MDRLDYVNALNKAIAEGKAPEWRILNPWPPKDHEEAPLVIETVVSDVEHARHHKAKGSR